MRTYFDEIIDLALVEVRDYKIDKLYNSNIDKFKIYCDGFLIRAIGEFNECMQSLDYDELERAFFNDLTREEISILADYWVIEWLKSETQTVEYFNLHLNDRSFKHYSEATNFREKRSYLNELREKVKQKIVEYQINNFQNIQGLQM